MPLLSNSLPRNKHFFTNTFTGETFGKRLNLFRVRFVTTKFFKKEKALKKSRQILFSSTLTDK